MARKTGHALFFGLPSGWRETILEVFESGGSDVEAHLAIGVTATEQKILLKNEDYLLEFENGMAICEAYWMKWARENVSFESKNVNNKLFEKMMNRLFDWDKRIKTEEEKGEKKVKKKKDAEEFTKKYKLGIVKKA